MENNAAREDLVFAMYLLPMISPLVYAVVLWAGRGVSAGIPRDVYLTVTKDPWVFLIGAGVICAAVFLDMAISPRVDAQKVLSANRGRVLRLAYVILILGVVSAWSASDYSIDLSRVFSTWIEGRYSLIYPLFLFLAYVLLSPSLKLKSPNGSGREELAATVLLMLSPLSLLSLLRLDAPWLIAAGISGVFFTAGIALILLRGASHQAK